MDKLEKELEELVNQYQLKLPKSDNTISGYAKKLDSFTKLSKELLKKINLIGNDYLKNNNNSEKDIKEVQELCIKSFNDFVKYFKK